MARKNKKFLLILPFVSLVLHLQGFGFDSILTEHMRAMEKSIEQSFNQMQKMHESINAMFEHDNSENKSKNALAIDISHDKITKTVVVKIVGITSDSFKAEIVDANNELTIKTPQENITIELKKYAIDQYHSGTIITADLQQKIKKEQLSEGKQKHAFYGSSSLRSSQLIDGAIDLDKNNIDYDKTNETLTVTMPLVDKKKTTRTVPVNILEQSQKSIDTK